MVDREARDNLADLIEAFLNENVKAFSFHDQINAVADDTNDETVHEVVHLLWYFYDDIKDHTAALKREEWDYFQRLLLLLRSEALLKSNRNLRWLGRNTIAIAAIVSFITGTFLVEFGWQLLLMTIPLGFVSMVISHWSAKELEIHAAELLRLTPYSSYSELRAVYRTVPEFKKRRYPKSMKSRKIRRPITSAFLFTYWRAMWLIFSPLVLAFQAFPKSLKTTQVVLG